MNPKLDEYVEFLKKLSLENDYLYSEEISELDNMIESNEFNIAVIGEFSVGKSTFLNALMGKRVLFSATREATGVSTRIVNSGAKKARIIFERDNSNKDEIIDLTKSGAYKNLEGYLNRENALNQIVKGIEVEYPIEFIDRSVGILDTPGLGGLTGKELDIAKNTLNMSNMSILVIGNQGIKDSELQLLLGKNEKFGKIKTKETVIVMNKNGEYFDKYDFETASRKIKKSREMVENELKKNGIHNMKVLAIDSRDYLWSKDESLYNLAKEKGLVKLTREEYERRSNFNELINYLSVVTSHDYKEQVLFEELKENILILLSEFKNQYVNTNSDSVSNIQEKINLLERRKISLIKNKRNIVNAVKRQVNKLVIDFDDFIKGDILNDNNSIKKQLVIEIDKIDDLDVFTQDKEIEILVQIDKVIDDKLINYNRRIFDCKNMIFNKVLETFDKKVKLAIKSDSLDINYNMDFKYIENNEIKNIRREYNSKISTEDERILDLRGRLNSQNRRFEYLICEKKELNSKKENYNRRVIEFEREQNKINLNKEINGLEPQPEPQAVYSYRDVTTGILWWKKTKLVKEFDYFDYSDYEKWNERREKIYKKYNELEQALDKKNVELYDFENKIKRNTDQISICKKEIKIIEDEINYLRERNEEKIIKYKDRMLDKAKTSLNEKILVEVSKKINSINYQLETVLDNLAKSINNEIEIKGGLYLDEYKEILTKKYNKLIKILNDNNNIATIQIEMIENQIKKLA